MLPYTPEEAIFAPGPWVHGDVSANGARFRVVTSGSGPLVLLLHGFPMFWWTWRHLIPELAARDYRVAAMDLRGYGGSDHTPRGYDLFTLSRDISGVIRSLGERNATLVGHGIGGLIGWSCASLYPTVVNRLVAIAAPHPVRMRESILKDRAQLQASSYILGFQRPWIPERNLVFDDAELVGRYLSEWSANPAWPDQDESDRYRAAFLAANTAHCSIEYHRWALRSIPRPDGRRFATEVGSAKIMSPVLQIHGGADRTVLPRSAEGARRFMNAPYAWRSLAGVGHFPQEEAPELTSKLITEWLGSDPAWDDPLPGPLAIEA